MTNQELSKQLSQHSTTVRSAQVPVISIIIPTYNKAEHLARLLPSILEQTYDPKHYEVIVVDDGSSDDTHDVVSIFKDQFDRFLYIRQANKGIGGARNTGLKHARGELISFLADDYVLSPNYLEQLSIQFKNPEVKGVRPLFDSLGRSAVEMAVLTLLISGMRRHYRTSQQLLCVAPSPYSWGGAAMTRRTVFEQHGDFKEDLATGEDSEYATRLDRSGIRIHVYNDVLFRIKNRTRFVDACRRFNQYAVNGTIRTENEKIRHPSFVAVVQRKAFPVRLLGLIINPVRNTLLCTDNLLQALRVAPLVVCMTWVTAVAAQRTRWRIRREVVGLRGKGHSQ